MSLLKLIAHKAAKLLVLTHIASLVCIALIAFCAGGRLVSPSLAIASIASIAIGKLPVSITKDFRKIYLLQCFVAGFRHYEGMQLLDHYRKRFIGTGERTGE